MSLSHYLHTGNGSFLLDENCLEPAGGAARTDPCCHSDLNDQNLFHSTIDVPPGVPGVSKNPDDQTEVHSGKLER